MIGNGLALLCCFVFPIYVPNVLWLEIKSRTSLFPPSSVRENAILKVLLVCVRTHHSKVLLVYVCSLLQLFVWLAQLRVSRFW